MESIRIGMIGCGVVGQGVMRLLHENAAGIGARLGGRIEVKRIVTRDPSRERGPHVPKAIISTDIEGLLTDPNIDVVVEVAGGIEPAASYVRRALEAGKAVVTANKALLADRGHALMELADAKGVDLYFEAAVAGGIPVIRVLREALASDRITALRGIVNGTSNYILSRMQREGMDFAQALKLAQEAGYAEADPTLDVGGGDAAHKLTILARLAFGARIELSQVSVEGIERVSAVDIEFARRFGYVIKSLAIARAHENGELELRVHPALVPQNDPLAHIHGALNAVQIEGAALGPCLLSGAGAGSLPTAVSVVADIVDVGRNLLTESAGRLPHRTLSADKTARVRSIEDVRARYYLRFSVRDQSGVLGKIATALGAHDVSIEQMVQDGHVRDAQVSVVLLTHPAREANVRAALKDIDALPFVFDPTCALRIEG